MRDETLDTIARGSGPGRFAAAIGLAAVAACGIPDDPRGTTREVLEQGTLRAGVSESPPWLVRRPVFAVPPGENAWLTRVETYLLRERSAVEGRVRREPAP